ncbi:MAG: folate-binding protein [Rhodospirillales bacterium]
MKQSKRTDRGVIRITGEDAPGFLQGLISNDINKADGSRAIYAALLTPQGKYLFDFFVVRSGDALLLDCLASDVAPMITKLTLFKLRSKVTLEDVSADYDVFTLFGDDAEKTADLAGGQTETPDGIILYADPRLPAAGVRAIVPKGYDGALPGGETVSEDAYQRHRIRLGLPQAPDDLQKDKSILLESGFDELAGIDWKKGCYMGQELTARTKYRGLVKKRLVPVTLSGGEAESGSDLMADGKTVGELRSVNGDMAMALIRINAIQAGSPIMAGAVTATPALPAWLQLPEAAETADE